MEAEKFFAKLPDFSDEELLDYLKTWDYKAQDIIAYIDYIYQEMPILDSGLQLYDCCGTGGDGANTFNISTAAAIVTASTGIKVCKNGGRSTTSRSGSVDVLEKLGYDLNLSLEKKLELLKTQNLAFISSAISAKLLAPVKEICRKNKITSFLSLIGPLTNPLKTQGQVIGIGIGKEKWFALMADICLEFSKRTNKKFLLVQAELSGQIFDELIPMANARLLNISDGGFQEQEFQPDNFSAADFSNDKLKDLEGGCSEINAQIIKDCFNLVESAELQCRLNTLALNSATIQTLSGLDLEQGFILAEEKLKSKSVIANP